MGRCAGATVTVVVPLLAKCVVSPLYVAVIVCVPVPTAEGVYVTEQLAELPLPASVHVPLALKVPVPLDVKLTVPVGVVFVPVPVSVTVAVHVVDWPTVMEPGAQLTAVLVGRCAGATVTAVVPELPACTASPP